MSLYLCPGNSVEWQEKCVDYSKRVSRYQSELQIKQEEIISHLNECSKDIDTWQQKVCPTTSITYSVFKYGIRFWSQSCSIYSLNMVEHHYFEEVW